MPVMTLLSKNIWLIPRKIISTKFLIAINLYRFLLDRIYRIRHDKYKDKKYKLPRWFNRPRLNLNIMDYFIFTICEIRAICGFKCFYIELEQYPASHRLLRLL